MAGKTKEMILGAALELFAQSGYSGASMSDIAARVGITKAALYKHYAGKQEILDRIIMKMNQMDRESAVEYEMPQTDPDAGADDYAHTTMDKIRRFSIAQFRHWTEDSFSGNFRKLLTLEQYRDPALGRLYHDYIATGPLRYMAAIFREIADSDSGAMQLALDFYGPMFLLYSVYDGAEDKDRVICLLEDHIDCFGKRIKYGCTPKE